MKLIRENEIIQTDNVDFIIELKAQGFVEAIAEATVEVVVEEPKAKPKAKKK